VFHPRERRALEVALRVVDILQAEELRSRRAPHFAAARGQEGNEKNDDGGRQKACVSPQRARSPWSGGNQAPHRRV
jgi:hypothetical protein